MPRTSSPAADRSSPHRVVVLHGAHGGPDTNWFPWLHEELAADGLEVVRPRLPTPAGQSLEAWLAAYDQVVGALAPAPTTYVGHSLGAAFALHLVERATTPVEGLVLASGFLGALGLEDYDQINASFFAEPFDWRAIRERTVGRVRCWAGDDDPYIPLERSRALADRLGAPLEVVPGGGHLNDESGVVALPAVRDAVRRLARRGVHPLDRARGR